MSLEMIRKVLNKLKKTRYVRDESGLSVMEMGILFPILMAMLMAVYDLGNGIVINQKTVSASQVIADLVSRNEIVDMALISDIVNAGELALDPYPRRNFGYDIASVIFDDDADPVVLWRVTDNMEQGDNPIDATTGLGNEGEGVVVVTIKNDYKPLFSGFVIDEFNMNERAFLRGRKSETVNCSDCP